MADVPNKNAGMRVLCSRCAKACQIAATRKTDARVAIEAQKDGLCAECIVSAIIKDLVIGGDERHPANPDFKVDALRLPHVQEQFARVIKLGGSNMPVDRLDWDEVIANWDLPIPKKQRNQLF